MAVGLRTKKSYIFLLSKGANAQYQSEEGLSLLDDTLLNDNGVDGINYFFVGAGCFYRRWLRSYNKKIIEKAKLFIRAGATTQANYTEFFNSVQNWNILTPQQLRTAIRL